MISSLLLSWDAEQLCPWRSRKNSSCPESSGAKNLQQVFRIIKRHSLIWNLRCEKDAWQSSAFKVRHEQSEPPATVVVVVSGGWGGAGIVQAQLPAGSGLLWRSCSRGAAPQGSCPGGSRLLPAWSHWRSKADVWPLGKSGPWLVLFVAWNHGLVYCLEGQQSSGLLCRWRCPVSFSGNKSILGWSWNQYKNARNVWKYFVEITPCSSLYFDRGSWLKWIYTNTQEISEWHFRGFSWYIIFPVSLLATLIDLLDQVRVVLSNLKGFPCFGLFFFFFLCFILKICL